jgi:peptidylprolyl isomerase
MVRPRFAVLMVALAVLAVSPVMSQRAARRPLAPADIDHVIQLVRIEDTRVFDQAALESILKSAHPEVRRRAVVAIGRVVDPRGKALLVSARADRDPDVVATVAFSTGQLKDADAVAWLGEQLLSATGPAAVAFEAARALGKIRSPEARAALAGYLRAAAATPASAPVVGEALLAIGRFTTRDDIAPIVRWVSSPSADVRWRAAWALFRQRDPAGVPHLARLADDPSADVRYWAVRGLAPILPPAAPRGRGAAATAPAAPPAPIADVAGVDRVKIAARLRDAVGDPDRRVRTEALRALAQYDDDASFAVILAALDSIDPWLSVSAAEVMGRFPARAAAIVPRLIEATDASKPAALRVTALAPLVTLAPEAALDVAAALVRHASQTVRAAGRQALQRLGEPGKARLDALPAEPPAPPRGAPPVRTDADYRRIVERWIVPDYEGAPRPRAVWDTPRGAIEIELYPGDAPVGTDYFVSVVESGAIVGTEFGRVVPNFVAQQRPIAGAITLRDEVSRLGLTRGNVSWASSGLDTGRAGYTLGNTPQPHNEGDFTALGRVVSGMDVVDRLELGDAITGARMTRR